jgi:16S rRNA (guanine966-N2)-methyltransferase
VTRIIAGAARGRRLAVPPGTGTRPTSDRAREALFSTLVSMLGPMDGLRVLDLYAGSGAVGLEALSRGAEHVLLVESDRGVAGLIAKNVATVGLPGALVRTGTAAVVVANPCPDAPYDVVFLDPPYATSADEVAVVLQGVVEGGWLAPGGVLVAERPTRGGAPVWPEGVVGDRERRYGEGTLWYGRASEA